MCVSKVFCSRENCRAHVLNYQSPVTTTVSSAEQSTADMQSQKRGLCSKVAQEMNIFSLPKSSGWLRCYSERLEERFWISSGWARVCVKITVAAVFCGEYALPCVIKDSAPQIGPLGRYRLGNCWLWIESFSPQPEMGTKFGFPEWQQSWTCPEIQFRWQKKHVATSLATVWGLHLLV